MADVTTMHSAWLPFLAAFVPAAPASANALQHATSGQPTAS